MATNRKSKAMPTTEPITIGAISTRLKPSPPSPLAVAEVEPVKMTPKEVKWVVMPEREVPLLVSPPDRHSQSPVEGFMNAKQTSDAF